jgi:hypothetical protein
MSGDSMTTDDLIATLSREDPRPERLAPASTLALATFLALALVLTISFALLKPRQYATAGLAAYDDMLYLKLLFSFSVVAGSLPMVRNLSIPSHPVGWVAFLAAAPFAVITILALGESALLPTKEWLHHVGNASWLKCLWQIPALAIAAFLVLAIAVRRLAPTKLVRVGASLGLVAGGIGAVGYAVHCHDDAISFVAASYSLAILEAAVLGAVVGPRVLRWR